MRDASAEAGEVGVRWVWAGGICKTDTYNGFLGLDSSLSSRQRTFLRVEGRNGQVALLKFCEVEQWRGQSKRRGARIAEWEG